MLFPLAPLLQYCTHPPLLGNLLTQTEFLTLETRRELGLAPLSAVPVWVVQLSLRRVFSENGPQKPYKSHIGNIFVPQLKKSDCGLIKGEFVNTRVLLGLFMRNRVRGCLRLLGILVTHALEKFLYPLVFVSLMLNFSPQ